MSTAAQVGAGIAKSLKVVHLDWMVDRYLVGYWARNHSIPPKVGVEPGTFHCPACKRNFITARPIRDALLDHMDECYQT